MVVKIVRYDIGYNADLGDVEKDIKGCVYYEAARILSICQVVKVAGENGAFYYPGPDGQIEKMVDVQYDFDAVQFGHHLTIQETSASNIYSIAVGIHDDIYIMENGKTIDSYKE